MDNNRAATARSPALIEMLGAPARTETLAGSRAFVWTIDPEGDGVIYTRSARRTMPVSLWLASCAGDGCRRVPAELRPRTVIAEGGVSGNARVHGGRAFASLRKSWRQAARGLALAISAASAASGRR